MPKRTNVEPLLRWSLRRASREFSISVGNLGAKLSAAKEHPGPDSCFSTSQITTAVFGDLWKQRHAKLAAETAKIELETGILRADYLNRADIEELFRQLAEAIRTVINSSQLTSEGKNDIFRQLSGFKVRVGTLAEIQRQRRAKSDENQQNGDGSEPSEPGRKRKPGRKKQSPEAKQPAPGADEKSTCVYAPPQMKSWTPNKPHN